MALPFGIWMGVAFFFMYGSPICLMSGVMAGALFGVTMATILSSAHQRAVSNMPYGVTEETLGVQHVRDIDLEMPYDKAFDLCLSCLYLMQEVTVRQENRSTGEILAKTGGAWKTAGDQIAISVKKVDDSHTRVTVSSRPAWRWTIVDNGRNLANVERIRGYLRSQIAARAT